jgi:L-aspartate oxidase
MKYDVIIIGAGIAGLYAAINLPKDKKVLIINKAQPWECNTFYAQGGISTAVNDDDIVSHTHDTLIAGANMCNKEAVEVLSSMSQEVIEDMIARGFKFDSDENGKLLYTKEAAHSKNRILHAGGDATGRYLHHFLLEKNSHPVFSDATVVDLLINEENSKKCCGVVVYHDKKFKNILAHDVIIASGGVGSLYEFHTNSHSISADLHGICLEKGIELEHMEMMQFHPTVYVGASGAQKQLLSEALRGEGAKVEDEKGYQFLADYHDDAELAPRDIVSRAIFDYSQKTGMQVYLSFHAFAEQHFQQRFPNIYKNLLGLGFELPNDRVPISPAFHYAIGGIKTDLNGNVDSVDGLYAIGEVASTGVHGANRLASNSLLEGLVFAKRAVKKILLQNNSYSCQKEFKNFETILEYDSDSKIKGDLRKIMWKNVSIEKNPKKLKQTLSIIEQNLQGEIGRMLKLRLLTAKSIVLSALYRNKSIGVHYIMKEENE